MRDAMGTGQGLANGGRAAPARRPSSRLRGCAILHLDGAVPLRERPWTRELAVEFLDGATRRDRPTLAWLVAPEALWADAVDAIGPGLGLPPAQVARELAEAVRGLRVYADDHGVVATWTRKLFAAARAGKPPFAVRDLRSLVAPLRPDRDDVLRAAGLAGDASGTARRAAGEAIRHAEFVREVAAIADAREGRA